MATEQELKMQVEIARLLVDSLSKKYGAVVAQLSELEINMQIVANQNQLLLAENAKLKESQAAEDPKPAAVEQKPAKK